jgi:hypothetical protein
MLAFAKDDLRGAGDAAVFFVFVLHEIGTSHGSVLPITLRPITKGNVMTGGLHWKSHKTRAFLARMDYGMGMGRGKVLRGESVSEVIPGVDSGGKGRAHDGV